MSSQTLAMSRPSTSFAKSPFEKSRAKKSRPKTSSTMVAEMFSSRTETCFAPRLAPHDNRFHDLVN